MSDAEQPMTVRKLIALLKTVDPDLPVGHYYDGSCVVGTNSVEVVDLEFYTEETDTVWRRFAVLSGPEGYELNLWAAEHSEARAEEADAARNAEADIGETSNFYPADVEVAVAAVVQHLERQGTVFEPVHLGYFQSGHWENAGTVEDIVTVALCALDERVSQIVQESKRGWWYSPEGD